MATFYTSNDSSEQPEDSNVFTMSNGEQVRLEFEDIFIYRSVKNGSGTSVDIGYLPYTETLILDIPFATFDEMYQTWDKYEDSQESNGNFPC